MLVLVQLGWRVKAQSIDKKRLLQGQLKLDASWGNTVYLCYVPNYNEVYLLSNSTRISEATMVSQGNFEMDISFLPQEDNVFRLQLVKKGDSPNSLILGGSNENHLFLIANCFTQIVLQNKALQKPPFKDSSIEGTAANTSLNQLRNTLSDADSILLESSTAKHSYIQEKLREQLRHIADTCSHPLVSLFALCNSCFKSHF